MSDKLTELDVDKISRNRIVSETDYNFFVEAGAGSGKTTMLVNRMVAMVEQGKDIEKICAITFTKAAAGEFYERFHKLLVERSNPDYEYEDKGYAGQLPPPTDETRGRCLKALQNIDLCFMGTIDSFCNMVLSEHPSEAKIPSDATVVSNDVVDALYKQEYVNICKGKYGNQLAENADLFKQFHRDPEEVFVRGMQLLMNNRNVHMNYTARETYDADSLFANDKSRICKLLNVVSANFSSFGHLITYGTKTTVKQDIYLASRTLTKSWNTNLKGVINKLYSLAQMRFPEDIFNYGVPKDNLWIKAKGVYKLALDGSNGLLTRIDNVKYDVSMTFLTKCVPHIEKIMRDKGYMTFFDYLYYLRNTLKEDAKQEGKLIRYINDRHSYFLIDEFQDTNPMQAEIFFYLASENPVEKWQDCVPRPGSLFIVGDPKQSIYKFRSADVASYLKVKKLFEDMDDGDLLYLSRNFRSRKVLCEKFNDVFSHLLVPSESQSNYTPIPIVNDASPKEFEGIYKYTAFTGKNKSLYPNQTDVEQIGKVIQSLVNNNNFKITTGGDKAPRTIKYNDIMIIVYGKGKLPEIMKHLDGKDIPFHVEGKIMFEENSALKEIQKIYKAVADSSDKMALYDALTGKVIGLQDENLLKYVDAGGKLVAYEIIKDESGDKDVTDVAKALEKFADMQKKALRLSPASIFSMILDNFGIYQYVEADNMEVLCYTLELLRNAERTGKIISPKDCCAFVDKLLSGKTEEERCLNLSEDKDCVRVANLHKVKGLEAPVVILAYAWPTDFPPQFRVEYLDNSTEGYLFKLDVGDGEYNRLPYFATANYSDKRNKEQRAIRDERDRLVYVAATRARNALIVCNSFYVDGFGNEKYVSMWESFLGNGVVDFFAKYPNQIVPSTMKKRVQNAYDLYTKASKESAFAKRDAEAVTYQIETPSHTKVKSKLDDEPMDSEVVIRDDVVIVEADYLTRQDKNNVSRAHQCPDLLGTMVHKLMEITVATRNAANVDDMIDDIIKEYITPTTLEYEPDLREALKSVATQIRNGGYVQKNGVSSDVLSTLLTADQVYTEVPFCYRDDSHENTVIWNGIMDVVYSKDGKWHIIDYKTNLEDEGLDKEYRNQLNIYAKAFEEIMGQKAEAKIYHIAV